jgi:hypothetical protein
MEEKDFNKIIDRYLLDNVMSSEDYENLNDYQKYTIQVLKRAFSRINKKEILTIHHSFGEQAHIKMEEDLAIDTLNIK